jgi:hypothetical protein
MKNVSMFCMFIPLLAKLVHKCKNVMSLLHIVILLSKTVIFKWNIKNMLSSRKGCVWGG